MKPQTNTEKLREKIRTLTPNQQRNFLHYMVGALTHTINNLDTDSAEMTVLLRELEQKQII